MIHMREVQYILVLFLLEILFFVTELVCSFFNKKNYRLKKVSTTEDLDFIKLNEGYRTSISIFRISIFISYLIVIFIYLDISKGTSIEKYFMIGIIGILVYMVSLYNIKTFIFYTDYFIVTAPFNFFKRDTLINYNSISNFRLYRALYNSYFLKIEMKSGQTRTIQFSGSFNPRNDLVVRIIINTEAGLKKNFTNNKSEDNKADEI